MGYKRAKIKMKKLLIISLMAILSINLATKLFAVPNPVPDYEQCHYFENVSASISTHDDGSISAKIENHNDHAVMVFWEIKAYDSEGRYVAIGRGQEKVSGNSFTSGYRIPTKGYSGWGIKIYNCKKN